MTIKNIPMDMHEIDTLLSIIHTWKENYSESHLLDDLEITLTAALEAQKKPKDNRRSRRDNHADARRKTP